MGLPEPLSKPNKSLRVLQVGMSPDYGGTEAIIYGIYKSLNRDKVQFDFLDVTDRPLALENELIDLGAKIYRLSLNRRNGYRKYLRGIKAFYKQHKGEFDVVVCNVQSLDQIDMVRFARKNGVRRTFIHVHSSGLSGKPSFLLKGAIFANRLTYRRYTDVCLACSAKAGRWGFGKNSDRFVRVIKNGIDIKRFSFSEFKRKAFRQENGLGAVETVYGSLGRMTFEKNQLFLLEVFAAIARKDPDARFVLVGQGPLETKLKNKAVDLGIGGKMIWISSIPDPSSFYCGIDKFIFTSLFEGLGIVLVEAQCSGLPCFYSAQVIPDEVRVSERAFAIPLEASAEHWAQTAIEEPLVNESDRVNASELVANAGWDIRRSTEEYLEAIMGSMNV